MAVLADCPRLEILIVSYGHGPQIRELLDNLGPAAYSGFVQVGILDQPRPVHGHDRLLPKLIQHYKEVWRGTNWSVRLIQSASNIGYGRAINALEQLLSPAWDYVLVLNPDVTVPRGALQAWLESMQSMESRGGLDGPGRVGLLAPALLNTNGLTQRSTYRFQSVTSYWADHSIFGGFLKERRKGQAIPRTESVADILPIDPMEPPRQVEWAMGAAWMVPFRAWRAVGGFDPAYFLYAEDTDFCWRLTRKGYEIWQDPSVQIVHSQGSPEGEQRGQQMVMLFDGLRLFIKRNYRLDQRLLLSACIGLDMVIRIVAFGILSGFGMRSKSLAYVRLKASATVLARLLRG